jgi:hypothetical protein
MTANLGKKITMRTTQKGLRIATVRLEPDEELLVLSPNRHYRLGYPVEDVVHSDIIAMARPVSWCSMTQGWVT